MKKKNLFIYSEILVNIFTYIVTSVYMITLGNIYVTRIRRRHAYNCLLRKRKMEVVSDFEKAEEFNGQFTDVFTKTVHNQIPLRDRLAPFMDQIVVTKEGVTKLIKGLNPSKALGPDELHPRVLKELAKDLILLVGPVFAHPFQQSINTGEIPKEWSVANICPLFKNGDRSLVCNYCPVSLTCIECIPCKLL